MDSPKFVADFMLGRLARWLRLLGFDTVYVNEQERNQLLLSSLKEGRIILTRDTKLSEKRALKLIPIQDDSYFSQIKQVYKDLKIKFNTERIYTLCSICNIILLPVKNKELIKPYVPQYTYDIHETFSICPKCKRVYWKGTHEELLKGVLNQFHNEDN